MKPISGKELREKSRPLVTCPSGATYRMRLPQVADLINCGALPQDFVAKSFTAIGEENKARELTDKDVLNNETVARAMITTSMLEPRIVERAEADDEIEYADIPPEDRDHLYAWTKRELPEQQINTSGGPTTVLAVETFSAGEQGSEPLINGSNGAQGRNEIIESAAA